VSDLESSNGVRSLLYRVRSRFEGPNTVGASNLFWAGFGVLVAFLAVFPILSNPYYVLNTTVFLVYGFLGLSLCLIWGYSGVLSFGQVAFFGIGGYVFGIVSLNLGGVTGTTVGLLTAVAISTLAALLLGYVMFFGGVRDVYVTIMTLVVTLVLHTFMAQTAGSQWTIGSVALGGFNGLPDIPDLAVGVGGLAMEFDIVGFYYLTLGILVATYLGLRLLVNSNLGYAMVAVRENEDRTELFGYDTRLLKLGVFGLGGALAGVGGSFYASWANYVDPSLFAISFAAIPVVWVTVGGRESLTGALLATIAIEWFRQQLAISGSPLAKVIVGALLLGAVLLLPEGVVPWVDQALDSLRERVPSVRETLGGAPE